MSDRQLRRLLEKQANFHVPLGFGDPDIAGYVGAIIDLGDADGDRPVVGHLRNFGITLPTPVATGVVDIGLSLSRTVTFDVGAGASGRAGPATASLTARAKVRESRDVVVLVEPAAGLTIETSLLDLAVQVAKLPSWNFDRFAFVARVYAVTRGEVSIAKAGGGAVTLEGSAQAIGKAVRGELVAGVSWTFDNLYTRSFTAPGVFGVHLVKVTRKGQPRVI